MPLDKLKQGLAGDQQKPEIRRGQGVRLSTEEPAQEPAQDRTNAQTHKRDEPAVERTNRGVKLRPELIDDLKVVATLERRHMYEVMEEAIEAYLASKQELIQAYFAKRGGKSNE